MNRKWIAGAMAAALALPMAGCFEYYLYFYGVEAAYRFAVVGEPPEPMLVLPAVAKDTYEAVFPVDIEVNAGGLSGNYEVSIAPSESAPFGTFGGTGEVKRGRFVTIKGDEEDGNLVGTVENMVSFLLDGAEVELTKVRAKVTAYQTPGGVDAGFRCTVTFSGAVQSGPDAGRLLKKGKISMVDEQPTAD
jgi:hypothetical protein